MTAATSALITLKAMGYSLPDEVKIILALFVFAFSLSIPVVFYRLIRDVRLPKDKEVQNEEV